MYYYFANNLATVKKVLFVKNKRKNLSKDTNILHN